MTEWRIPEKAASENAEKLADEYAMAQRDAFIHGYKAAAAESESLRQLREWAETQRDEAREEYEESDDPMYIGRRLAFIEMLTRLSEMGCTGGRSDHE